jgi:hypothetical protein
VNGGQCCSEMCFTADEMSRDWTAVPVASKFVPHQHVCVLLASDFPPLLAWAIRTEKKKLTSVLALCSQEREF